MKLTKLHIEGSVFLLNKNTHSVIWTPESPHQLLMGNNGYGKSTIQSEFSILPAEAPKYTKQGYKEVIVEHNGHVYKGVSDFSKKHVHSFYVDDGDNLNQGGTITIQKDLIVEYLGYTQDIHDLLLGKILFTGLSETKRKEWFAKISEVNVDFGLKLFGALKTESRNLVGARKHVEGRILQESVKLLSEERITELKETIETLRLRIEKLNKVRDDLVTDPDKDRIKYLLDDINQYTADLQALDDIPNRVAENFEEFKEQCIATTTKVTELTTKLDTLLREQELLNNFLKLLQDEDAHPVEQLIKQRDDLSKGLPKVPNDTQELLKHRDPTTLKVMVSTLEGLVDDLDDLYGSLYDNPKGLTYNGEKYDKLKELHKELSDSYNKTDTELGRKVDKLNRLKSHDPINCPKCTHQWVPGVSEEEIKVLSVNVKELSTLSDQTKQQLDAVKLDLEHVEEYVRHRRNLSSYATQYPILKEYWGLILNGNDLNDAPKSLITFTRKFLKELTNYHSYRVTSEKIEELSYAIAKREQNLKEAKEIKATTKTTELEDNIYQTTVELKEAKAHEVEAKRTYLKVTQAISISDKLRKAIDLYYKECTKHYDYEREQILKKVADQLSTEHYVNWTSLNQIESVNKVVEHLKDDLEHLNQKQLVIDALTDALSPTSGLIANTLVGFMNEFVAQMNNVISRIWTTKLHIGNCAMANNKFTYMFPVTTESDTYQMKDVSKGSTGEKDIFNFTFRLIAMQFLGLKGYPLLTDELGSSFKTVHRRKLYDYLKLLTDSGTCSQLVAISHFTDTVDELNRAEQCVIDTTGLTVPEGANQNFKVA